jgi:hypothetical protein
MKLRTLIVTSLTLALVAPTVAGAKTPIVSGPAKHTAATAKGAASAKVTVAELQLKLRKAEGRVTKLERQLRKSTAGAEKLGTQLRAAKRLVAELRIALLFAKDDLAKVRAQVPVVPQPAPAAIPAVGWSTGLTPAEQDCVSYYGSCTDEQLCITWGERCNLVAPLTPQIAASVETIESGPVESQTLVAQETSDSSGETPVEGDAAKDSSAATDDPYGYYAEC